MPLSSSTRTQHVAKELTVQNRLGLHARPAAAFVRACQSFRSEIVIVSGGKRFDGGRLMDVLTANLDFGAAFTLEATGTDAHAAVDRLEKLMAELRDAEARGEHS